MLGRSWRTVLGGSCEFLISVSKKGPDGKLEIVGIHDMLREICMTKAEEEGFLHHTSAKRNAWKDNVDHSNRRLSIHCMQTYEEWEVQDSRVRSLLLFSEKYLQSCLSLSCWRLNILDVPEVTWPNLSRVISTFVNLRYIAFALNETSCPDGFPASIFKLPNLQTIVAHKTYLGRDSLLHVPVEIWEMPKLRHFIIDTSFRLSCPIGIINESDLRTLETVRNFRFTEETIKILVNLKKLKVMYHMCIDNWDDYNLYNLFHLQNLEELQVSMLCLPNQSMMWNRAFPISLKKLTLQGVPLPWGNMTMVGSLPNLQVLEMLDVDAPEFSEWAPMEGQFLRLKYFCSSLDNLVKWEVEKEHFPSLESLILNSAWWIDEIPCGIGKIDSLQLIELQHCHKSLVNSAKQIKEHQHENGNDAFQVRVIGSDE